MDCVINERCASDSMLITPPPVRWLIKKDGVRVLQYRTDIFNDEWLDVPEEIEQDGYYV